MIAAALLAQLGFGFALPQNGPLLPFGDCVTAFLRQVPADHLRYDVVAGDLGTACGELARSAAPQAIDAAVTRAAASGNAPPRAQIEQILPILLSMGVMRAIDDELRARGIEQVPPVDPPAIRVSRPSGK